MKPSKKEKKEDGKVIRGENKKIEGKQMKEKIEKKKSKENIKRLKGDKNGSYCYKKSSHV